MRNALTGVWFSGILISLICAFLLDVISWTLGAPSFLRLAICIFVIITALVIAYFIDRKKKKDMATRENPASDNGGAFIQVSDSHGTKIINNSVPKGTPLANVQNSTATEFEGNEQRD